MKPIAQFTVFAVTALSGFIVRGDGSDPPKYQPRLASSPQNSGTYLYAPAGSVVPQSISESDQPVSSVPDTSSLQHGDRDLVLSGTKEKVAQLKEKLTAGEPASSSEQAECLRMAAVLAELGGLEKDAKHLRDEAEKGRAPLSVVEVLERRQAQLDALQSQVAALRRMTRTERQIMVEIKMVEVPRAAMKALVGDSGKTQGVIDTDRDFLKQLDDLRTKGAVKVLAEPALVTVSGRPAYFNSGGELPFMQNETVNFKSYGTQVDVVPVALGNDKVHLDVKVRVSQPDGMSRLDHGKHQVPSLRVRECHTAVECRAGQTVIVGGLIQKDHSMAPANPADVGAAEKPTTDEATHEVQLLVVLRATFIEDSGAAQTVAPAAGAGNSAAPAAGYASPGNSAGTTQATKTK